MRAPAAGRRARDGRPRSRELALAVSALLWSSPRAVRASGFHVDEQDARAAGRAGAVVASPGNASAIYYNPAGIAELRGLRFDAGGAMLRPTAEFTPAGGGPTTRADTSTFLLPQLFASWRASELVALGIGFCAPYGLALDWPASSPGRAQVREIQLTTFFITPAWGLNLSRWVPGLSAAVGPDLVPASVRLERDIPFGADLGTAALSASGFGLGGRAGVLYRPAALPGLSLGVTYRSSVRLQFRGDGDFEAPAAYRGSLPPDGEVRTHLRLPQMLLVGVAYRPLPAWEIEADFSWRGWSSFDRLAIELPNGQVQTTRRDWEDSITLRAGTEVSLAELFSARLGAVWDQTPQPTTTLDFLLPDADRFELSLGGGAQLTPELRADLGVLWVLPQERSTSLADPLEPPVKGRYRIDVWVVNLTVGIQLGAPPSEPAREQRSEASRDQ